MVLVVVCCVLWEYAGEVGSQVMRGTDSRGLPQSERSAHPCTSAACGGLRQVQDSGGESKENGSDESFGQSVGDDLAFR